jgi:hypothetical protein
MEGAMVAMILFTVFCSGSIVFLISFFVALCRDRKRSYQVLKICRETSLDARPASEPVIDGVSSVVA